MEEKTKRIIPVAEPDIGDKELEYVMDAVKSGWVSSRGKYITLFEKKFAEFCGVRYAISTSNGTTALHLAIVALGIGRGDEVIVPTFTFVATASTVIHAGATPVFVDSEPLTWCIDPAKIEEKITPKTKAITVVHLYGHPADMEPILEIAKKYNIHVIEDAAEAHGAEYKGKKVGSLGDVGIFSFFGNKIITTGEGGMIVTDNKEIAEKANLLKNHGMDASKRYWHPVIGYNYRMTNLQAALGVAQLERIEEFIEKKRNIVKLYNSLLADVQGITLPPEMPWAKNVYWMYSILVDDSFGFTRDELTEKLKESGIDSRPFFYPIHTMPPYKSNEQFPVAEELSGKGISLPSAVNLTKEDTEKIANTIKESR